MNSYYESYLKAVSKRVNNKIPPSMIETELKILQPCDNAREYLLNGLRNYKTKNGGECDFYSDYPNGVVNAYSLNARGKVVRIWCNKYSKNLPTGDRVSESVIFDQIRLNTITPLIWLRPGANNMVSALLFDPV